MTFNDNMSEVVMPTYAEIYEFAIDGEPTTRYTSHNVTVELLGQDYIPARIERQQIKKNIKFNPNVVELSAPIDATTGKIVSNFPVKEIRLKIFGVFIDDQTCQQVFEGKIIDITVSGADKKTATVKAEGSSQIFRDDFPRVAYSGSCNWFLFEQEVFSGFGCKLMEIEYATLGVVTVLSNGTILKSAAFASPVFPVSRTPTAGHLTTWYINGHVTKLDGSDMREITDYNGSDEITIAPPFDSSVMDGVTMLAYPGCDLLPATCRDKFKNEENLLATPYISTSNPALTPFKS